MNFPTDPKPDNKEWGPCGSYGGWKSDDMIKLVSRQRCAPGTHAGYCAQGLECRKEDDRCGHGTCKKIGGKWKLDYFHLINIIFMDLQTVENILYTQTLLPQIFYLNYLYINTFYSYQSNFTTYKVIPLWIPTNQEKNGNPAENMGVGKVIKRLI